ncbi:MAG: diaminopimelate decarboxylase [Gammaproteobacteria bacterium]|nr:diaminopimelate decarboxylase [Gammaproteobacteria bacterium]MYF37276.1 diaminopimelate decarboxylase [Gammaproteobacteria bacterium]
MPLSRTKGVLRFDGIPVSTLGAFAGTPVYVYSWNRIADNVASIAQHLRDTRHRIHYAVKANSNHELLRRLARLDIGFDVVSVGELERVLRIGGSPNSIMFSGVGKSLEELAFAIKVGIGSINVESSGELSRIITLAKRLHVQANIMFRINPCVDTATHPYLATALDSSKFGLSTDEVVELAATVRDSDLVNVVGLSFHLGSQISEVVHFEVALSQLIECAEKIEHNGVPIDVFSLGGGFATQYRDERSFSFSEFAKMVQDRLRHRTALICIEPGRAIVADAGILITRVEYLKRETGTGKKNFAIVDAGTNDLLRPVLYDSWHDIVVADDREGTPGEWDIVGPICESSDVIGRDRMLTLSEGDLLVIQDVGAYGFSLSSNYNSRLRVAELLVSSEGIQLIKQRESLVDLVRLEDPT